MNLALKMIRARHNMAIMTVGFILSLPVQFLIGIQIAKWIV